MDSGPLLSALKSRTAQKMKTKVQWRDKATIPAKKENLNAQQRGGPGLSHLDLQGLDSTDSSDTDSSVLVFAPTSTVNTCTMSSESNTKSIATDKSLLQSSITLPPLLDSTDSTVRSLATDGHASLVGSPFTSPVIPEIESDSTSSGFPSDASAEVTESIQEPQLPPETHLEADRHLPHWDSRDVQIEDYESALLAPNYSMFRISSLTKKTAPGHRAALTPPTRQRGDDDTESSTSGSETEPSYDDEGVNNNSEISGGQFLAVGFLIAVGIATIVLAVLKVEEKFSRAGGEGENAKFKPQSAGGDSGSLPGPAVGDGPKRSEDNEAKFKLNFVKPTANKLRPTHDSSADSNINKLTNKAKLTGPASKKRKDNTSKCTNPKKKINKSGSKDNSKKSKDPRDHVWDSEKSTPAEQTNNVDNPTRTSSGKSHSAKITASESDGNPIEEAGSTACPDSSTISTTKSDSLSPWCSFKDTGIIEKLGYSLVRTGATSATGEGGETVNFRKFESTEGDCVLEKLVTSTGTSEIWESVDMGDCGISNLTRDPSRDVFEIECLKRKLVTAEEKFEIEVAAASRIFEAIKELNHNRLSGATTSESSTTKTIHDKNDFKKALIETFSSDDSLTAPTIELFAKALEEFEMDECKLSHSDLATLRFLGQEVCCYLEIPYPVVATESVSTTAPAAQSPADPEPIHASDSTSSDCKILNTSTNFTVTPAEERLPSITTNNSPQSPGTVTSTYAESEPVNDRLLRQLRTLLPLLFTLLLVVIILQLVLLCILLIIGYRAWVDDGIFEPEDLPFNFLLI